MSGSGSGSDTGRGGGGGSGGGGSGANGRAPRPLRDEDNPFLRQLQLMLDKSASNRAAAVSPSFPRAGPSTAASSPTWRPMTAISGGDTIGFTSSGSSIRGETGVGSRVSQIGQPLSAHPKKAAAAADIAADRNNKASRPRSPPRSLMDLLEDSSSDDEAFHRRLFSSTSAKKKSPPSVAEDKKASPSSDGGWPETKRCSPPNLKASSSSTSSSSSVAAAASAAAAASSGNIGRNPGITGGRAFGGAGITGSRPPSSHRSSNGGGFAPAGRGGSSGARASMLGRSAAATAAAAAGSDNEWMSDAEDNNGPAYDTAAPSSAEATRGSGGLKRGRTPPSGGDARGRKTGRLSERYPAPVPARKHRSNSLSLSPSRLLPCDSDYVTSEEETLAIPKSGVQGARARAGGGKRDQRRGGGGGEKEELPLSSAAATRRWHPGAAAEGDVGGGRGRKRGHEDLLNDRIEALRVGSDGEGPEAGGGHGKGRKREGRVDLMADEEEEEDDDDVDYEDRRPSFENPPWLGELVPYDLGGGGFINPSINRYLREYQREGVRWLHSKFKAGEGGILGDDMGLGKTVQSITLLSAALKKTGTGEDDKELRRRRKAGLPASATGLPWLIVAPASVVRVWVEHLKLWGYFSVFQLESGKDVDDLMAALSAGRYEVVATSYDLLRSCVGRLKDQRFDAVLFDEYHTIKSASARVSQAACELKTKRVFGLTGTLIQNDMKELWFLLHLIDPRAVGEKNRFTEHFSEPIKRARAMNATAWDRRLGEKRLKELDAIRGRNMIRRTKDEELGDVLKGKSDTVVFCDLSEAQRDLYKNVLALPEFQLLMRAKDPCDCGRSGQPPRAKCCYKVPYAPPGEAHDRHGDGIDDRAVLFRKFHRSLVECDKCPFCSQLVAVSKLQKIANHPCLLQENVRDPEPQRRDQREFAEVAFTERAKEIMGGLERSQKFLDVANVGVCGKMKSLETLLSNFYQTGDKVLVFSWSTTMLDVLESFMGAKGYVYRRLDGSTSHKDRQSRIKEFNSECAGVFVFLVSTRAGGQGLNLHTASRVILYDVNWNPALELQAQDRAYRIGQKNKVSVFRLISKGTIEEMCYMRQIYKLQITSAAMGDQARGGRRQFNAVQGSKGQEGELFGILNLLKFSDGSLLKALRMKHEAALAAARAGGAAAAGGGGGAGGGKAGDGGGGGGSSGSGSSSLGVAGVETADETELMIAMKVALDRAKEEIDKDGAEGVPEDSELAGLLGVLGVDAYTHDQLVAKDEGEEEPAEESCGVAELSLSPLPNGGARNAMEETVVKPRGGSGGGSGGGGMLFSGPAREKKGTASRGWGGGGGRDRDAGGRRRGTGSNEPAQVACAARGAKPGAGVTGEAGAGQPTAPQPPQEPPKKRRNLALIKPGDRAGTAAPAEGRGAAAGGGGRACETLKDGFNSGKAAAVRSCLVSRSHAVAVSEKNRRGTTSATAGRGQGPSDALLPLEIAMANRRARPSLLLPAWRAFGFIVGSGATALLPAEASAKVGAAIGRAVQEQYDANIRTMYEARIEEEESEVKELFKAQRDDGDSGGDEDDALDDAGDPGSADAGEDAESADDARSMAVAGTLKSALRMACTVTEKI
eukprot:g9847.t1